MGFSLLEMLIVLAIMAGLMAMVWPNLQRPLQRANLNEAASTVRSLLEETRYDAMVSSRCYLLRFESGSDQLSSGTFDEFANQTDFATPSALGVGSTTSFAGPVSGQSASGSSPAGELPVRQPQVHRLPAGVQVVDVRWSTIVPADQTETDRSEGQQQNADVAVWWLPILASGASKDASIRLEDSTTGQSIWVVFTSSTGSVETQ